MRFEIKRVDDQNEIKWSEFVSRRELNIMSGTNTYVHGSASIIRLLSLLLLS